MKRKILGIICLFSFFNTVKTIQKGSSTAVSIEPFFTFPATDSNNKMVGFGAFVNGFALEDATTSCTFDSLFPVANSVTLNDGTLFLTRDINFGNPLVFTNGGTINGNTFAICLPKNCLELCVMSTITDSGRITFEDVTVVLNGPVAVNNEWRFKGTCKIRGRGNKLRIKDASSIVVDDSSSLIIEDVQVKDIGNGNVRCAHDNGVITLKNSHLCLSHDYSFTLGALKIECDNVISGTSIFSYATKMTSTIESKSSLFIDHGTTFKYEPPVAKTDLICMYDFSSVLYLNGSTLHVTHTGMKLSRGMLLIDNHVTMSSEGRNSGESIVLHSNLDVHLFGGAVLDAFGPIKCV